jgi:HSP20 family molecular chaperone IbpA
MESFLKRHFVSALAGAFLLGAVAFWGGKALFDSHQNKSAPSTSAALSNEPPNFDDIFNHDFFKQSRDPFKEMDRMQNEIMKNFGPSKNDEDSFGHWFKQSFGGGAPADFKMSEDDRFVYYEIDAGEATPEKVDVEVHDRQVTVKGEMKKKEENSNSASFYGSTFVRSFPAPENVDADHFKLEQKGNKIIIKFPKTR